ncbi:MAG: hypothetical protein Q6363_007960 [Candidatus Njordarchaeota archaeon]
MGEDLKEKLIDMLSSWFWIDIGLCFGLEMDDAMLVCEFRRIPKKWKAEFIVWSGDDDLYEFVKDYTYKEYTREELIELVNIFTEMGFKICDPEKKTK